MKHTLWLVSVCITALLLSACAINIPLPEETGEVTMEFTQTATEAQTEPAEPDAGMSEAETLTARCRAVLDAVQSGTNYKITLTRWYEGVCDSTNQITYYRSGDNRAMVSRSTAARDDADGDFLKWLGTSTTVSVDGSIYSGYAPSGEPTEWEGPLKDETLGFDPWMYTFDWDAQAVTFSEYRKTADGYCVSFTVDGPYPNDRVLSEDHTITFYFDEADNFLKRELIATGVEQMLIWEPGSGIVATGEALGAYLITRVDIVTIESLDPDICAAEIDAFYQEALAYQNTHG